MMYFVECHDVITKKHWFIDEEFNSLSDAQTRSRKLNIEAIINKTKVTYTAIEKEGIECFSTT